MDAAEKNLFLKLLDTFSTSATSVNDKKETELYLSEPYVYFENLHKRADLLKKKSFFSIGDIVVWKDGLKNKRYPNYNQPSIILTIFNPALEDKDDVSFTETVDIQLGFINENDEFFAFNYDSNRFKKFDPPNRTT